MKSRLIAPYSDQLSVRTIRNGTYSQLSTEVVRKLEEIILGGLAEFAIVVWNGTLSTPLLNRQRHSIPLVQ
jgi:hypothetical protein